MKLITILEILLAVIAILLDWFIPTLVILAIMAVSMLVRKQSLASIGLITFYFVGPLYGFW